MKKTNKLSSIIKNGCVIYTLISVFTYIAGTVLSAEDKAFIPTLKWTLLFLLFSLLLASANLLLKSKTHTTGIKLFVHFLTTAALYFVTIVLCGGFIKSGAQTLIAMMIFVLLYAFFAIVYALVSGKSKKKKNKKEEYHSVFK